MNIYLVERDYKDYNCNDKEYNIYYGFVVYATNKEEALKLANECSKSDNGENYFKIENTKYIGEILSYMLNPKIILSDFRE